MNIFGHSFRITLLGESHGPLIGIVIDGHPAGLPLKPEDFTADLDRRRPSMTGSTFRREEDRPEIKSGLYRGKTTGAPLGIFFQNQDQHSQDYMRLRHFPRPGHADWTASKKYGGFNDPRGGGRFSGRLTVGLVAAGAVAKKIIHPVQIKAEIIEIGGSQDFAGAVGAAIAAKDSVAGLIECRGSSMPAGLGEPFFDSLESMLSHIIFSIPGIKGIEFGAGFQYSRMRGSECNDPILDKSGRTESNHAGGINGGISSGNQLVFKVAVKPTPSIGRPQETLNTQTGKIETLEVSGRHDACIALRMPVIVEAAAAIAVADLSLRRYPFLSGSLGE
jgi:chorismate synthase